MSSPDFAPVQQIQSSYPDSAAYACAPRTAHAARTSSLPPAMGVNLSSQASLGPTYGLPPQHGSCANTMSGCNANMRVANTSLAAYTFDSPSIQQWEKQRSALVPEPDAAGKALAAQALATAQGGACPPTPLGAARVSNLMPWLQTTKIAQWKPTATNTGFQDERSLRGPVELTNIDRFVMLAKPNTTPTFRLGATDSRQQMDAFYQAEFMNACRGTCSCDANDSGMI